ncbi:Reverse transcriptase domain [Trinorchestia longiramus]|nr:Reverse transcriptase domain [Trinorchestia longiramus]
MTTSLDSTSATSAPQAYPISPTPSISPSPTSLSLPFGKQLSSSPSPSLASHPLSALPAAHLTPLSCRQSAGTFAPAAPDGSHPSLRFPTRLPSPSLYHLRPTSLKSHDSCRFQPVLSSPHRFLQIDLFKAFDTVPHPQLIFQISSLPLNYDIVRWLVCYLKGRLAKCSYHHHLSSSRPVLAGVPQGSVISPALFNLHVSHYPPTTPLITSYADDFTALATTIKIPDASAILSAHSSDVATWAQQKDLTISIAKFQSFLFTPDTHQSRTNPHVTWEGTDLTHCRSPKILGITFDPHFTFTPHINT